MRRIVLLTAAALVLTACSGEPSNREKPQASESGPPVVLPSGKPTPSIPATKPTTLQQTDLIVGTGESALPGKTVTVRYLGVHFENGKEFDSTFEPGDNPFSFVLGNENVIAGWDEGLIGMREGGRRQLVIPPDLAYGARGRPPIGPNETLVFVVDLISVDPGI